MGLWSDRDVWLHHSFAGHVIVRSTHICCGPGGRASCFWRNPCGWSSIHCSVRRIVAEWCCDCSVVPHVWSLHVSNNLYHPCLTIYFGLTYAICCPFQRPCFHSIFSVSVFYLANTYVRKLNNSYIRFRLIYQIRKGFHCIQLPKIPFSLWIIHHFIKLGNQNGYDVII